MGSQENNDALLKSAKEVNIFCAVFLVIVFVLAFSLNATLASIFLKTKSTRTNINIYLMSTVIHNLIMCSVRFPILLTIGYLNGLFYDVVQSKSFCKMAMFLRTADDVGKLTMFLGASFERYFAVSQPFKKDGQRQRILVATSVCWAVSIIGGISASCLFIDSSVLFGCVTIDYYHVNQTISNYESYVAMPTGFLCFLFILALYCSIFKLLHEQSKKMAKKNKSNRVNPKAAVPSVSKRSSFQSENTKTDIHCSAVSPPAAVIKVTHRMSLEEIAHTKALEAISNNFDVGNAKLSRQRSSPTLRSGSQNNNNNNKSNNSELQCSKTNSEAGDIIPQELSSPKIMQPIPQGVRNGGNVLVVPVFEANGEMHMETNMKVSGDSGNVVGAVCVLSNKNRELGRRRVEWKAARRMVLIFGVFACLWLPQPLATMIGSADGTISVDDVRSFSVTSVVAVTSSFVNPLLCALLNKQLKNALLKQLTFKRCCTSK